MTILDYLTSDDIDNQNLGLKLLNVDKEHHLNFSEFTKSMALRILLQKGKIAFTGHRGTKNFIKFLNLFCNFRKGKAENSNTIYFISFKKVNYEDS